MSTLRIYASTSGTPCKTLSNQTWATIRDGNGSGTYSYIYLLSGGSTGKWTTLSRYIAVFDTSGLSGAASITSATLTITLSNNLLDQFSSSTLNITSGTVGNPASIVAADYQNKGSTEYSTAKAFSSLSYTSPNVWTLNAAGLAAIDIDGNTIMFVRLGSDISNTAPSWNTNKYARATPTDIYLDVEYVAGTVNRVATFDETLGLSVGGYVSSNFSKSVTFTEDAVVTATPNLHNCLIDGYTNDVLTETVSPAVVGYSSKWNGHFAWATIHDAATGYESSEAGTLQAQIMCTSGTYPNEFSQLYRGIVSFDTSAMAATSSVLLRATVSAKTDYWPGVSEVGITTGSLVSSTDIANDDYDGFTGTEVTDRKYASSLSVGATTDFAIDTINYSGYSIFFIRTGFDIDNTAPTWNASEYTDIQFTSPQLIFTYPDNIHLGGEAELVASGYINDNIVIGNANTFSQDITLVASANQITITSPDIIVNGDFEEDFDNWTTVNDTLGKGTVTVSTSQSTVGGTNSAYFYVWSQGFSYISQSILVGEKATVTARYKYKVTEANAYSSFLRTYIDGTLIHELAVGNATCDWTQVEIVDTTAFSKGLHTLTIRAYAPSSSGSLNVYVDEVEATITKTTFEGSMLLYDYPVGTLTTIYPTYDYVRFKAPYADTIEYKWLEDASYTAMPTSETQIYEVSELMGSYTGQYLTIKVIYGEDTRYITTPTFDSNLTVPLSATLSGSSDTIDSAFNMTHFLTNWIHCRISRSD